MAEIERLTRQVVIIRGGRVAAAETSRQLF
jgi:ABC-type multidrug transport system ATPase subunit